MTRFHNISAQTKRQTLNFLSKSTNNNNLFCHTLTAFCKNCVQGIRSEYSMNYVFLSHPKGKIYELFFSRMTKFYVRLETAKSSSFHNNNYLFKLKRLAYVTAFESFQKGKCQFARNLNFYNHLSFGVYYVTSSS